MRTGYVAILLSFLPITAFATEVAPLLYLAGDSTMAQKPLDLPERGWGMALNGFLKDPAMVQNHAVNGRSTRSFIDEGRWDRLVRALQPGDFVLIQFGHNDEKVDRPGVGTNPDTEFRDNLRRFIRDARARQAIPLLATPIARRKFDETGELIPTHGPYPDAIRAVAKEQDVAVLDLERASEQWLRTAGDDASKAFFMWIDVGAHPKLPQGRQDDTHLVDAGALKIAELAVAAIREQRLDLAHWLK
ncbi:MAG TPA: rhamnogalacturonan acetylesterase [Candidatus Synoicihabitans sp.]|nr:rhamnogalacturonan acetylesterase [Candidatus Synoicihabitans sp.]